MHNMPGLIEEVMELSLECLVWLFRLNTSKTHNKKALSNQNRAHPLRLSALNPCPWWEALGCYAPACFPSAGMGSGTEPQGVGTILKSKMGVVWWTSLVNLCLLMTFDRFISVASFATTFFCFDRWPTQFYSINMTKINWYAHVNTWKHHFWSHSWC